MELVYREEKPEVSAYCELFETTDWNRFYKAAPQELEKAIATTWYSIGCYCNNRLVGYGRILSDGILYAVICDMIVVPEYQRRGIGSTILKRMLKKCQSEGLRAVWLFSAPGKAGFYRKHGFEERAEDAPGMQVRLFSSAGRW